MLHLVLLSMHFKAPDSSFNGASNVNTSRSMASTGGGRQRGLRDSCFSSSISGLLTSCTSKATLLVQGTKLNSEHHSQSQRGVLAALIVQAVQEERYYDAADLQQEYEILTMGRADVTQDEGSYDRFLDADDWYMRDLMKSKKKKQ